MSMSWYVFGAANPQVVKDLKGFVGEDQSIEISGFLDNNPDIWGEQFHGYPVLGGIELVQKLAGSNVEFVNVVTGSTLARKKVADSIVKRGGDLGNLISPMIDLDMVSIDRGLYLQRDVGLQAGVNLGFNVSIHDRTVLAHDVSVGSHVFIGGLVLVNGCVTIREGAFIGGGANIMPRITVGAWSTVGAGSVVTKDVPDKAIVAGCPAKIMGYNP